MQLNCDMGESFGPWQMGLDSQIMPWIDMANIACGFHASDPDIMAKTVELAAKHKVYIGAHPGYQDKQGFGRRHIPHSLAEITHLVLYQVGALEALCQLHNTRLHYIKPHGALYNSMMADQDIYLAILKAVSAINSKPSLMILARRDNQKYQDIADSLGVPLLFEAFADRAYTREGLLVPRSEHGAVYHDAETITRQVLELAQGSVTSLDGHTIPLKADTVCVHGDNPESVALIRTIKEVLLK